MLRKASHNNTQTGNTSRFQFPLRIKGTERPEAGKNKPRARSRTHSGGYMLIHKILADFIDFFWKVTSELPPQAIKAGPHPPQPALGSSLPIGLGACVR